MGRSRSQSLSSGRTSFMAYLFSGHLWAGWGGAGGRGNSECEGGERARFTAFESRCARKLDERGAIPFPARALSTCHLGTSLGVAPRTGQGNSKTFYGPNPFRAVNVALESCLVRILNTTRKSKEWATI